MAAVSDFTVDRSLIDANFEGYKLSLEILPIYKSQLDNGIAKAELTDSQFSYHHAKLFGVHNHLVLDPWCPSTAYLVDKSWIIVKATAFDLSLECAQTVLGIPDRSNQSLVPGRYNISIKFVAVDLAAVSDGAGNLHIVDTGNRVETGDQKWKIILTKTLPGETTPCFLMDAVQISNEENHKLECLMVHVSESTAEEKDKYRSQYLTNLEWLTFSSVDRKSWSQDRNRKLVGRRPFHYAALDRVEPAVVIAAEADFQFTFDSEIPVVEEEEEASKPESSLPEYTWYQTGEDVTVHFTVPEGVTKADVYLTLSTDHLDFGIKNTRPLLNGQLTGRVDVDTSTWTIDGQKVELTLCKQDEGPMWPLVVEADTRGEMVVDPSEAALIHERLAHLTSEEWNPDPNVPDNKPYNAQQLEECDDSNTDNLVLARWDGNTHRCTHTSNLGSHQWLFNTEPETYKAPRICIRHDVDGLLWQPQSSPKSKEPAWLHKATLNAFGYVQASKQTRKFSACPQDFSYAVISDEARHIYVYRQSTPVNTPLRNRKTGKEIKTVAKQHVVTLEGSDVILGLQATNEKLFVLTEKNLFMLNVKIQ